MDAVALLAVYNEELFIAGCVRNLVRQGMLVYLLDNGSTDRTVAIAQREGGTSLIGVERMDRDGVYRWRRLLERKEQLAEVLDADWFMHLDADEVRLPARGFNDLLEFFSDSARQGYNSVAFQEYAFTPVVESPDHEHPCYEQTMRWYYPICPRVKYRITAWRKQDGPVDLMTSGGHEVSFAGRVVDPRVAPMRHYLFLSLSHAKRKYIDRRYAPDEVAAGWHRARATLNETDIWLPAKHMMRGYDGDESLDASQPLSAHPLFSGRPGFMPGTVG